MVENDPFATQRDVSQMIASELGAEFDGPVEIGRGGFGVVYRCAQIDLDRTVAVKVLTAELDNENLARFFREQRAMGRLTGHPNIVGVLQVGTTGSGRPYIVMQFHPHGSLESQIRELGALTLEAVLRTGVRMSGALETAHRAGILHRDVKPGNILLTDYGEPALSDFGIAHVAGAFKTATGAVTGSPAYTAPEVLRGDPTSVASDIYGLGATLFCALTGHAAFERHSGEQVVAQFLRITTQPVPDLRSAGYPEDVCALIEGAMSQNPQDRPMSAAVLGEMLRDLQRSHGLAVTDMAVPPSADAPLKQSTASLEASMFDSRGRSGPVPSGASSNLPVELTSFVGRRNELTETKRLLSMSRLVTLAGIGGVGKTRVAVRVASTVKRDFRDGVWLVELGEVRDESAVVDVVAGVLGLRDLSARPMYDVLVEFLTPRSVLLVLDNCEQVVAAVADLAEILVRSCPNLRVLTTSREALGIAGEAVLRLPPLRVPDPDHDPTLQGLPQYDAVKLFAERGAAAVPEFEVTEGNQAAVVRICQRLDGLPLPIELAAARLRAMSPEQILQRLTDRLTLLARGSRGVPTRQQTLRLCIDWSYELCTAQEQRLWARISVFAGSFELDAAEQICGVGDLSSMDLLDLVTSLIDKSILIREEAGAVVRFRMLETLREYGREKAEQTEEYVELRRRHRDWYQQLALDAEADWISARQLDWIARLERELPNLREALEFCITDDPDEGLRSASALYALWTARALYTEGRRWFDRLFAQQVTSAPTVRRVKALCLDSLLAGQQRDLESAANLVERAHLLAEQVDERAANTFVTHAQGILAFLRGNLARACALLERSHEAFRASGDITMQIDALLTMGLSHDLLGEAAQSVDCYEQVLTITESRGESMYRSYALWATAIALWRRGDTKQATARLEQGLVRFARYVGDRLGAAWCLETLAWIAGGQGNAERAVILMTAAEALGKAVGASATVLPDLAAYHQRCEQRASSALLCREGVVAQWAGTDPTGKCALEFAHDAVQGQSCPVAFGSASRRVVMNRWAAVTRVAWWCQPSQERPSK